MDDNICVDCSDFISHEDGARCDNCHNRFVDELQSFDPEKACAEFEEEEQEIKERIVSGSALDVQVAGDHYREMKIQPAEFIHKNDIGYLAGRAIAYAARHSQKNGKQDLEKAIHTLQLLIEQEYPNA